MTEILFSREHLPAIVEAVRSMRKKIYNNINYNFVSNSNYDKYSFLEIRSMAKSVELPSWDLVKVAEAKLGVCRNKDNDPDSDV